MANKVTVSGRLVGVKNLYTPDDNDKYKVTVVLDDGQEKKLSQLIKDEVKEKWGDKPPKKLEVWGPQKGDDEEYEVSFGHYYINPKAKQKPQTIMKQGGKVEDVDQTEGLFYAGCYVYVSLGAFAYDGSNDVKSGVTLRLRAVMFKKHGEHLGDHVDAESEFEDLDSDLDDDEFDPLAA